MELRISSNSSKKTTETGKLFAGILDYGDIVLLSGELGAGKTTFISGIARGLGSSEGLSSPSFTILNIYSISKKNRLVHADFYRLESIGDILNTGIEEYLYSSDTITCIEWGDKISSYLKINYLAIIFEYDLDNKDKRKITIKSTGAYWDKKIIKLKQLLDKCIF